MAVKIRLRRMGGKKDSFFRIVVADSRSRVWAVSLIPSVIMIRRRILQL